MYGSSPAKQWKPHLLWKSTVCLQTNNIYCSIEETKFIENNNNNKLLIIQCPGLIFDAWCAKWLMTGHISISIIRKSWKHKLSIGTLASGQQQRCTHREKCINMRWVSNDFNWPKWNSWCVRYEKLRAGDDFYFLRTNQFGVEFYNDSVSYPTEQSTFVPVRYENDKMVILYGFHFYYLYSEWFQVYLNGINRALWKSVASTAVQVSFGRRKQLLSGKSKWIIGWCASWC